MEFLLFLSLQLKTKKKKKRRKMPAGKCGGCSRTFTGRSKELFIRLTKLMTSKILQKLRSEKVFTISGRLFSGYGI